LVLESGANRDRFDDVLDTFRGPVRDWFFSLQRGLRSTRGKTRRL
jgi:hypothetical protein